MHRDVRLAVVFYRTSAGSEPVREWLKSLSKEDKKTIGSDIKTVQYGWALGMPVVRILDQGRWEVRSRLSGRRIVRIVFTIAGERMILLHGFINKVAEDAASGSGAGQTAQSNAGAIT